MDHKKQDHKGQLDNKKWDHSDQIVKNQEDWNARIIRDGFLQFVSKDTREPRGKIINLKKLAPKSYYDLSWSSF